MAEGHALTAGLELEATRCIAKPTTFTLGKNPCFELRGTCAKRNEILTPFTQSQTMICPRRSLGLGDAGRVLLPEANGADFVIVPFRDGEVITAVALHKRLSHGGSNSVYTDSGVRITIDIDDAGFGSFCP